MLETFFLCGVLFFSFRWPFHGRLPWVHALGRRFNRFARHRSWAVATVGLLGFLGSAAISSFWPGRCRASTMSSVTSWPPTRFIMAGWLTRLIRLGTFREHAHPATADLCPRSILRDWAWCWPWAGCCSAIPWRAPGWRSAWPRGYMLAAARLAAAALGPRGRPDRGLPDDGVDRSEGDKLLESELLGRRLDGVRRRPGLRRSPKNPDRSELPSRPGNGSRPGRAGEHPSFRGPGVQLASAARSAGVAGEAWSAERGAQSAAREQRPASLFKSAICNLQSAILSNRPSPLAPLPCPLVGCSCCSHSASSCFPPLPGWPITISK